MGLVRTKYYLKKANSNQWRDYDYLLSLQLKRLKKLVKFAYHNVTFYHNHFKKANVHPSDINSLSDLNKIPLVTKKDIYENYPKNIVKIKTNLKKCIIWETSGSTGIPLKIAYDSKADDFANAIILRSYLGNGLKKFDKWCVIAPPEFRTKKRKSFLLLQKLKLNSPFYISDFNKVEKKVEILKDFNPRVLDCPSTDLFLIAKYIKENDVKGIKPEIVTTNAEILDKNMRKYINEVFKVELSDVYGCMELRRTAWECPKHEGYHMDIDSVITQFLKDGEEVSFGERGKIVFTGLFNYTMPIIRYDIGDMGIPSDHTCSCGRSLPMMKIMEGKILDFLISTKGELVSPHIPKGYLLFVPGVKMFKLTQYSKYKLKLKLVKSKNYKIETNKKIENTLKSYLGDEISIDIEFVDKIKRDSRKYKVIESKCFVI